MMQIDELKSFAKEIKGKLFFDYDLKFPTYVEGLNNIRNKLT